MAEAENNPDEQLSVTQVAKELGISIRRVAKLCKDGRLGKRLGVKMYVISRRELIEFAKIPRRPGPPKGTKRKKNPKTPPDREDEPKVIANGRSKIGVWIKDQREQREWTQKELAEKLGSKYQSDISFWEGGTHVPKTDACVKLAKAFSVDVRDVLRLAVETELGKRIDNINID